MPGPRGGSVRSVLVPDSWKMGMGQQQRQAQRRNVAPGHVIVRTLPFSEGGGKMWGVERGMGCKL